MAKNKLTPSASDKIQGTSYKARYEENRRRRLEKHLKNQPNDEQAQEALKNISYRRQKPNVQGGWVAKHLRDTPIFKGVTGRKSLKRAAWVQSQINRGEAYGRALSYVRVEDKKKAA